MSVSGSVSRRVEFARNPHLVSAIGAVLLIAAVLAVGDFYARAQAERYIHALAPQTFQQKNQGSLLQRAAFRQPDLLPVYGSSELLLPDNYHASKLFEKYPTGFMIFPVGSLQTESLIFVQKLAALGGEVRGKKMALSLSTSFFADPMMDADAYAGNFSPLHANALAFNMILSPGVKRDAAKRMLQYPQTLKGHWLLRHALAALADGSPPSQLEYITMFPLGQLQLLALTLQDDWETLTYISSDDELRPGLERVPRRIDWQNLKTRSERDYALRSNTNPFGIDNRDWNKEGQKILQAKNSMSDEMFLRSLQSSAGWGDLNLLLRAMQDLGLEPLILAMPQHGPFYDYLGVSARARTVYYDSLEAAVRPFGFRLVDFRDHDEDKYFLTNPLSHLSSKGWIYYAQNLDAFYHEAAK